MGALWLVKGPTFFRWKAKTLMRRLILIFTVCTCHLESYAGYRLLNALQIAQSSDLRVIYFSIHLDMNQRFGFIVEQRRLNGVCTNAELSLLAYMKYAYR